MMTPTQKAARQALQILTEARRTGQAVTRGFVEKVWACDADEYWGGANLRTVLTEVRRQALSLDTVALTEQEEYHMYLSRFVNLNREQLDDLQEQLTEGNRYSDDKQYVRALCAARGSRLISRRTWKHLRNY